MTTIADNTIIHADCLQVLPQLPEGSVNFVLTDPPYITNDRSRDGHKVPGDDTDAWLTPAFVEIHRVLEPNSFAISLYGWPHADRFVKACRDAALRIVGHLMFPKRYSSASTLPKHQHECAHLLAKGRPEQPKDTIGDVTRWSYTGNKLHPTQKPLSILTPAVETFSAPNGLVLDPFAGSGSTLVAAQSAGRRYPGIELDAGYHGIAQQRLIAPAELAAPLATMARHLDALALQAGPAGNTGDTGERDDLARIADAVATLRALLTATALPMNAAPAATRSACAIAKPRTCSSSPNGTCGSNSGWPSRSRCWSGWKG